MTDINIIDSSNSSRCASWQKLINILKFIWLPVGFIIFFIAANIESQIVPNLLNSTVNAFCNAPELLGELIRKIAESNNDTNYIVFEVIFALGLLIFQWITIFFWGILVSLVYTVKWFPVILAVFSFLHVSQCFIARKPLKKKWAAVFLRILTLIFAIVSIVFVVLFVTCTIPLYDFIRSWVLFFIGSIVLNIFLE